MNYGSESRAILVSEVMNKDKRRLGHPPAWPVLHRDGYYTVIASYLPPISFGEILGGVTGQQPYL